MGAGNACRQRRDQQAAGEEATPKGGLSRQLARLVVAVEELLEGQLETVKVHGGVAVGRDATRLAQRLEGVAARAREREERETNGR